MDDLIKVLEDWKTGVDFKNSNSLVEDGLLDSLDLVELIDIIEERYDIELRPEDIDPDNFNSVNDIWNMIKNIKF